MDFFDFLNMTGGLALFLYGMTVMGNSLSGMAGGKMEAILEKLTNKRIYAVLLGACVTAVIQSSSATTVMVVGFVNSGIMKLTQAVGIIMGANIGTTATSWILSLTGLKGSSVWVKLLKPTSFSPVLAMAGIIMQMTGKDNKKKKDLGEVFLGFAILMFGMHTMSSAVSGLSDVPAFTNLMTAFSNPVLGMLAGALLTAVIQSSSASVGILQALCTTGTVQYSMAIPIIMGQNIGTCITSIISSVGASTNAKRAAMIHLYFNLIGTAVFMTLFYTLNTFLHFTFLAESAGVAGIAVIHSMFNILATVMFYPFADKLVKLSELTIKDKKSSEDTRNSDIYIDDRFLQNPGFAMELCRNKVREMAEISEKSISDALDVLMAYDSEKAGKVVKMESLVDKYEDVIGTYLVRLSGSKLSEKDTRSMSLILHSISDFERISDHALDIVKSAEELHSKGLAFTESATEEIRVLCSAVKDVCSLTVESFCSENEPLATDVEPLEEVIDELVKTIKQKHIERLRKGECTIEMGFILEDVLTGLERISDHCSNIAVEIITIFENNYSTHGYFRDMPLEIKKIFNEKYEKLTEKYQICN